MYFQIWRLKTTDENAKGWNVVLNCFIESKTILSQMNVVIVVMNFCKQGNYNTEKSISSKLDITIKHNPPHSLQLFLRIIRMLSD